jgi:hypothetical protein
MSTLCEKSVFQFYFCLQPAKKSSRLSVVVSTPNAATAALDNPTVEGSAARPPVQANSETVQPTAITTCLPRKGGISIGSGTTPIGEVTDSQPDVTYSRPGRGSLGYGGNMEQCRQRHSSEQ